MEERDFNIASLEQKLAALKNQETGAAQENQPVWKQFDDLVGRMSDDQKSFVDVNENVVNARQKLMRTFNDWLFEKHKNEFVAIPAFAGIAQEYVEAVASTAQEFGRKAAGLRQENEELKRQLADLQAKQAENLL